MRIMRFNGKDYVGDISNTEIAYESGDELNSSTPIEVPKLENRETMKSFAKKVSLAVKNVRYLLKMIGSTDISTIGDGTVTSAIRALETNKVNKDGIDLTGDVTGTSRVDENTGKVEIRTNRRQISGHAGMWTEIATITISRGYTYAGIDFYVSRIAVNGVTGGPVGILHTTLMTNANLTGINVYSFSWEYANNVIPENFVLAYKIEEGEIHCSILFYGENNDRRVTFNVLTEQNTWNLSGVELSEFPSDFTKVTSTLAIIQNPISTLLTPFNSVSMPPDADFNDYKETGIYKNGGTNTGQINVPHSADNGLLIVYNSSSATSVNNKCRQIWIGLFALAFKTRYYNGSIWSEWVDIV